MNTEQTRVQNTKSLILTTGYWGCKEITRNFFFKNIAYCITHSVNWSSQWTVQNVQAETPQLPQTGPPMEGSSVPRTEPWRTAYDTNAPAANDVLWKQYFKPGVLSDLQPGTALAISNSTDHLSIHLFCKRNLTYQSYYLNMQNNILTHKTHF